MLLLVSSVSTSVAHYVITATGLASRSAHVHTTFKFQGGARSSKDLSSVFSTDSNSTCSIQTDVG